MVLSNCSWNAWGITLAVGRKQLIFCVTPCNFLPGWVDRWLWNSTVVDHWTVRCVQFPHGLHWMCLLSRTSDVFTRPSGVHHRAVRCIQIARTWSLKLPLTRTSKHRTVRCDHRTVRCVQIALGLEPLSSGFFFSPNCPMCTTGPSGACKNPARWVRTSWYSSMISWVFSCHLQALLWGVCTPSSSFASLRLKQKHLHTH